MILLKSWQNLGSLKRYITYFLKAMFCQVLVRLYQNFIRFIQDLSWVLQDLKDSSRSSRWGGLQCDSQYYTLF